MGGGGIEISVSHFFIQVKSSQRVPEVEGIVIISVEKFGARIVFFKFISLISNCQF